MPEEFEATPFSDEARCYLLGSLTVLLSKKAFDRTQYSGGRLLAGQQGIQLPGQFGRKLLLEEADHRIHGQSGHLLV